MELLIGLSRCKLVSTLLDGIFKLPPALYRLLAQLFNNGLALIGLLLIQTNMQNTTVKQTQQQQALQSPHNQQLTFQQTTIKKLLVLHP